MSVRNIISVNIYNFKLFISICFAFKRISSSMKVDQIKSSNKYFFLLLLLLFVFLKHFKFKKKKYKYFHVFF